MVDFIKMKLLNINQYFRSQNRLKESFSFLALLILISLLSVGITPEFVLAEKGFRFGRTVVTPGIFFETRYNDNVFLGKDKDFPDGSSQRKEEDFIFITSPFLIIDQKRQKGDIFGFNLKYLGQDERYAELKEQDFFSHDVLGFIELGNPGEEVLWKLGGQYTESRDATSIDLATNLSARQETTTFTYFTNLLWKITQKVLADINLQYQKNLFDGEDPTLVAREYEEYNANSTLIWQVTSLTGIGVNYTLQYLDYLVLSTINSDAAMQSGSFIFKWKPLSVLSGELWVGFNHLEVFDLAGQDRDDFIYKIDLYYQPKTTRSWRFTGFREIVSNSFFANIQSFRRTVAKLELEQKLGVKWKGRGMISYEENKFDIPAADIPELGTIKLRKDDIYSATLSLTYLIQDWVDVTMEYSFAVNDSNFSDVDFTNNIALLRLSFYM